MHEAGFRAYRVYLGRGKYAGVVEENAVAFDVPEATVLADDVGDKGLIGISSRHAAADHVHRAVPAHELDLETGDGFVCSVREQFFAHGEFRARIERRRREPVGIGHAAQLSALHEKGRALFEIRLGHGRKFALALFVAFAVMPLDISHAAAFFEIKGVDAVVTALAAGVVVNAAAGDYRHVRALADIKVVIDLVEHVASGENDGDMHAFPFDARPNDDVYAVFVLFRDYFDVLVRGAGEALTVLANVVRAFGYAVKVGYFHQKIEIYLVHVKPPCARRRLRPCFAKAAAFFLCCP